MVEVQHLYKHFGQVKVLEGIHLNIDQTGIIAVLGPNGSGKTTLIKSILGLVIPQKGNILIDNNSIKKSWRYRSSISYLSQRTNFPQNIKLIELINLMKGLRNSENRAAFLIKNFGLEPFLDKKLGTLSGGTRQKVNIVLSLMFETPIIILDEPTTGLDPVALSFLKTLLREEKKKGKIILLTTHIMSLVEQIADRVIFLLDGAIYFDGTVQSLKDQSGQTNLEQAIATILTENA